MPTDTTSASFREARNFALRAAGWSLGLFGVLRLPWIQNHALLPATLAQGRMAAGLFGTSSLPVEVTLACSGAEAIALSLAAVLAYPASWRMRLAGAGGGLALILSVNTMRIGTLGRVAASPSWFDTLHVYVWPAVLMLAIAGYVFGWMRVADRSAFAKASADKRDEGRRSVSATRRFILLSATFLLFFTAASPIYLESARVLVVAGFIARAGAAALRLVGIQASAAANVVQTPSGGLLVTQECIATPLIPIFLAAVVAYAGTWRRIALGVLATIPLFVGLGIARLLVVALPATVVVSPLFLIHAFYQLVLAAVIVFIATIWRHGTVGRARAPALMGLIAGVAGGWTFAHLPVSWWASGAGRPITDPQGALAFLPAFQAGLYIALWMAAFLVAGWLRFLAGFVILVVTQMAFFIGMQALAAQSVTPHVRDVRAWSVVGPLLVIIAVVNVHRVVRLRKSAYRSFWADVGARFPDLDGAASTRYYADNERRLFRDYLAPLDGLKICKTDLWDEAKNTRILAWAKQQGARTYGIDISEPTVFQARGAFAPEPCELRGAVADVRELPFRTASFDAIYSMGTIEHFDETEHAVEEIVRVLKPGGRAIIGVPNRHDPFLRPLVAAALQAMRLYAYGYEKSYSRRALREMLERAGLKVVDETAILFIPGWLRMLDLACHSWCRPLTIITGAFVWPFAFLDRHVPAVRRHGYLLATVAMKPEREG